jgi:hypothetical protein
MARRGKGRRDKIIFPSEGRSADYTLKPFAASESALQAESLLLASEVNYWLSA